MTIAATIALDAAAQEITLTFKDGAGVVANMTGTPTAAELHLKQSGQSLLHLEHGSATDVLIHARGARTYTWPVANWQQQQRLAFLAVLQARP